MGITSQIVERNLPVRMRDGATLYADVYRASSGRHPVLVTRTPYIKEFQPGNLFVLNPLEIASAGYVAVVQDVRGRGESEGEFAPFAEDEDGYDTVAWASEQPWSNGQVGTYGSSYMAATQMQAAVTDPPNLVAVCPIQASSDYYEGRSYQGGAFELGALLTSTLGAMTGGSIARMNVDGVRKRALAKMARVMLDDLDGQPPFPLREWLRGEASPLKEIAPWFFEWLEHQIPDAYWTRLSLEERYGSVSVPGLHITSWYDQFHTGTLRNYSGLRRSAGSSHARENQYLVIGPWYHYGLAGYHHGSVRVGDRYFGTSAAMNMSAYQLAWFDRCFTADSTRFRQAERVRYFLMGADEWRFADDWPISGTQERRLYLRSRTHDRNLQRLSNNPTAATGIDEFLYQPHAPVPTLGGAHLALSPAIPAGPVDQAPLDNRQDIIRYVSDVLGSDLEVTGAVRADLVVSSSAPMTDFTARLIDVYPDGRALSVCDGIRRVRMDAKSAGGCTRIIVELGATAQLFRAGHRIRLDITSSNYPRFDPNPNTGKSSLVDDEYRSAVQTVYSGGEARSCLVLTVVPPQSL